MAEIYKTAWGNENSLDLAIRMSSDIIVSILNVKVWLPLPKPAPSWAWDVSWPPARAVRAQGGGRKCRSAGTLLGYFRIPGLDTSLSQLVLWVISWGCQRPWPACDERQTLHFSPGGCSWPNPRWSPCRPTLDRLSLMVSLPPLLCIHFRASS